MHAGFNQTTRACCGVGGKYNYDANIWCGSSGILNGEAVKEESCGDPGSYVIWDGVHWTDQANNVITKSILNGKYFEPAFDIATQCDIQPF